MTTAVRPQATPGPAALATHGLCRYRLWLSAELVLAALLYTVGAARSGWANAYYAAATQAGASNWHAFLFGSLDPAGGISIDKPPAAIWLDAASARLFGLSPTSLLWPQAACGIAAVALLAATVRRHGGDVAGLLAGALLAVTPVVTLLSRYDNPDALMIALLVGAAWTVTRAVDRPAGGVGWVVATGALVGLAFLTKLGQALLVLPALTAVVLVAAPGPWWRRVGRLMAGGLAMVVAGGWWVALVQVTPATDRPWVGGSTDNSVLGLALGYDGLARVTGAGGQAHPADWGRLLGSGGDEAGWYLPAAAVMLVLGVMLVRGSGRRDPLRAGLVLWGGWLILVGIVLSGLQGISHSYYAVEIAPAAAALVSLVGTQLWLVRGRWPAAGVALGIVVTASAVWTATLLLRRGLSWPVILVPVVAVGAGVAFAGLLPRSPSRRFPRVVAAGLLVAALAGPAAWSVATAQAVHHGSGPVAGPGGTAPADSPQFAVVPVAVQDLVSRGSAGYEWSAGVPGRRAADLQLAAGCSVFELGGYKGTDPAPTLARFQELVVQHRIHYLVLPSNTAATDVRTTAGQIVDWAVHHAASQHLGGWTVLDLSPARPGAAG